LETRITQHWIVSVARQAGLPGAESLDIPADTAVGAAWDAAARRLGVDADTLAARVAEHHHLPLATLPLATLPRAAPSRTEDGTFRLFPAALARGLGVLPLRYTDRTITVAAADPGSEVIAREIAEFTGRTVAFEVASPGALTEALALAYPVAPAPADAPPWPPTASGVARILVVDDDADSRALIRTVLEEHGYRVVEAADGVQALGVLEREGRLDLVTLDLRMEGMSGLELLRHMRAHLATAGVPVVVATGSDDPALAAELFEAGADDFVVKPVDPRGLLLRIQAVLRRRALPLQGF